MKNLAFAIWMVGFYMADSLSVYTYKYLLKQETENEEALGVAKVIIWAGVGILLYEGK